MSKQLITELKEFNAANLTANNQNFGSSITGIGVKVQFINISNVDVYITDGENDSNDNNWRVPAGGTITLDELTQDDYNQGSRYYLSVGAQLKIKQVTGSGTGTIIAHIVVEVN